MSTSLSLRGRLNALQRYRPADDPEVLAASRDLRAARLEEHVRAAVDAAPPLTDEQWSRLSAILRGNGAGDV